MVPEQSIKDNGYYIFREVFNSDEVRKLNKSFEKIFSHKNISLKDSPSFNISNCSSKYPEFNWILYNNKLISSLRQALGTEDIMYTSTFGIQRDILGGWHKDDGTGSSQFGFFNEIPYGNDCCNVMRVAIYLQEHDSNFPGIYLKPGSHINASLDQGEVICPRLTPGDVAVFDVRLTHSGTFRNKIHQKISNVLPQKHLKYLNALSAILRKIALKVTKKHKHAIFIAFGKNNKQTIEYSKSMMKVQLSQTPGTDFRLPEELKTSFEKKGIHYAEKNFNPEDFIS